MKKISLILLLIIIGCSEKNDNPPSTNPKDYFPMKVGTTWTYKIEIHEVEPLKYYETTWSKGNTGITYSTRGRFVACLIEPEKKIFYLKMKVKEKAKQQGKLEFPIGVELEIIQDDLGVFEGSAQVFWAASDSNYFIAHEITTHCRYSSGAPMGSWGRWGTEDGFSMRILFFAREPHISIGLGKEPIDTLLFTGIKKVPKTNINALHYVRKVKTSKDSEIGELNKNFTEDFWFVKGKGLIHLKQKVEGKKSMTWTLESFSR